MRNRLSKQAIKNLKCDREKGSSIQELMNRYKLPKTTIWHHVHKITLAEDLILRIKSNQGGSRNRCLEQEKLAYSHALKLLKEKRYQRLILAASMLYWAEGHK